MSAALLSLSPLDPVEHQVVLGVDTHRDQNTAAVVTVDGRLCGTAEFPTTSRGCDELLAWAKELGHVTRAGVECTGSYGASVSRLLQSQEIEVLEVNQPDRRARRSHGKTDVVDAEAAARAVLSGRATAIAKSGEGPVEAIRVLKLMRDSAVHARTKAMNQLKATLVTAAPALRETLTGLGTKTLVRRCSTLPDSAADTVSQHATRYVLRGLAQRILTLTAEADQTEKHLKALIQQHTPQLIERTGIGPDSAAALLIVAGDNHDRVGAEGSFAALCGVSPVEASSGNTQRRRLNRGGDRRANAALYRIVLSRLRWDTRTQAYMTRRLAEGRTRREIVRCLKRYVAREVFALITESPAPTASKAPPRAA